MVSLTPDQDSAVQFDRHIAVEAGAGAGKTTVLVQRYLSILAANPKLSPAHILTITFTRKSAGELMDRIHAALHALPTTTLEDRIRVQQWRLHLGTAPVGTIHALCTQILRRWGHLIGIDPQFQLIEDGERRRLWALAMTEWIQHGIRDGNIPLKRLLSERSHRTACDFFNDLFRHWDQLDPEKTKTGPSDTDADTDILTCFWAILSDYKTRLTQQRSLDFSLLQHCAVQLVREFPEVADQLAIDYPYIMIDEFQDTDAAQWELITQISQISTTPRCNVFVVGDIKQAIYGFRGSTTTLFQSVLDDFDRRSDCRVVRLTDNFRSAAFLIHFYNGLFAQLFHQNATIPVSYTPLVAHRPTADHCIEIAFASSKSDEFDRVAQWVIDQHHHGRAWDTICILSRKNAPLSPLANHLRSLNIPVVVMSNYHPMRTPEAQYLALVLRFLNSPTDPTIATEFRLRTDTVPGEDIDSLLAKVQSHGFFTAVDQWPLLHTDFNLAEAWRLFRPILSRAPSISNGLLHLDAEMRNSRGQTGNPTSDHHVRLMTIHSAKGLEFDSVAVIGCGDKLVMPASDPAILAPDGTIAFASRVGESSEWRAERAAHRNSHSIEEEKRTFYVGCTRAKDHLFLIGRFDPDRKLPETPATYFDFLLPHATIFEQEVQVIFPVSPGASPIQLGIPRQLARPVPRVRADTNVPPSIDRATLPAYVTDTRPLISVSVSQLIRWMTCSRQYYLSRVLDGFASPDPSEESPAQTGIVVHRCLEHLLQAPHTPLGPLVRQTANDLGIPDSVGDARMHLSTVITSTAFSALVANGPIPEYGFQLRCGTLFITGRIDCLSQSNGRWVITDFKTDRTPETAKLPRHHHDQLMIYAIAIAHAKRSLDPIEMQVIYTRTGESVTETCTHSDREYFATMLAQLPDQTFLPPDSGTCAQCPVTQWIPNCPTFRTIEATGADG